MKDFNSKRFAQFVKWDVTINAKLYRTMALVIFCTTLVFAFIHFALLCIATKSGDSNAATVLMSSTMLSLTAIIPLCSGFLLHNFRTKPKRILEMSMPASNKEKFLAHVIIVVIGSILVFLASMVIADGINALLTWAVLSQDQIVSLFSSLNFASAYNAKFKEIYTVATSTFLFSLVSPQFLNLSIFCSLLWSTVLYSFSNTFLYRYNIPATYIIRRLLSFIPSIGGISTFFSMKNLSHINNIGSTISIGIKVWTALYVVFAVVLAIVTYRCYTKAQLVNRLNH